MVLFRVHNCVLPTIFSCSQLNYILSSLSMISSMYKTQFLMKFIVGKDIQSMILLISMESSVQHRVRYKNKFLSFNSLSHIIIICVQSPSPWLTRKMSAMIHVFELHCRSSMTTTKSTSSSICE